VSTARWEPDWWHPLPAAGPAALALPAAPAGPATGTVPFAGLMAFTFVLLIAPQNMVPALGALRIALVTAGLAIAAQAWRSFSSGRPLFAASREMALVAALALLAVGSLPFSLWPGGTFKLIFDVYLKSLAVFWLVSSVVDTPARLRRTCTVMVALAVPIAITGLRNYASGTFVAGVKDQRIAGYEGHLTQNPNDLALMLNLILPLGIALFLSAGSALGRAALALALGVQAAAIVVTFSRAGFLTLACTGLLFAIKLVRRGAWGLVLAGALAAVVAVPALPAGYLDRLATITDVDSDPTGSAQERSRDLKMAVRYVVENPLLGAGAGMSILALNELRGEAWREVHSVYLQYAVELGLPGLALFLALLACCFAAARRAAQPRGPDPASRRTAALGEGIEISLAAFAVAAFFHPAGYQFYFFYLGGLALAARAVADQSGRALAVPAVHPELSAPHPGI
jgi:putative inorganic carbon (hco3(-)) transporter